MAYAGTLIDGARQVVEKARSALKLPVTGGWFPPAPTSRPRGGELPHAERDLLPHRHRPGAAERGPRHLVAAHPRHGGAGGHRHLRRPGGTAPHRGLGDAVLRVQPGRRRPDRQRLVERGQDRRPARRGRSAAGCGRGAADLPRRVELRYPARGADRRPQRHARDRDERRAAAGRARLPGPLGGPRALRLRVGHQVGRRHGGAPGSRTSPPTGPSAAGRRRGRSRPSRASTCPGRAPAESR